MKGGAKCINASALLRADAFMAKHLRAAVPGHGLEPREPKVTDPPNRGVWRLQCSRGVTLEAGSRVRDPALTCKGQLVGPCPLALALGKLLIYGPGEARAHHPPERGLR